MSTEERIQWLGCWIKTVWHLKKANNSVVKVFFFTDRMCFLKRHYWTITAHRYVHGWQLGHLNDANWYSWGNWYSWVVFIDKFVYMINSEEVSIETSTETSTYFHKTSRDEKALETWSTIRDYLCRIYGKFPEKLTFLTAWYVHKQVRITGSEMLVLRKILRKFYIHDPLCIPISKTCKHSWNPFSSNIWIFPVKCDHPSQFLCLRNILFLENYRIH